MKNAVVILFIVITLFLSIPANSEKHIGESENYKNDSKETIYLILELPPGQNFKNNTGFKVWEVNQSNLGQLDFQMSIQNKIDLLENSLEMKKKVLETLDEQVIGGSND